MLDKNQHRQDHNPRQNRVQEEASDNAGIRPVQGLRHRENDFVQRQVAPLVEDPLGSTPRDHKECDDKIKKEPDHLRPGLFPRKLC